MNLIQRIHARFSNRQTPEAEARSQALWQAIPDAVFEVDRSGRFMHVLPPKAFPLLMPEAEFIGRQMAEVLPEEIARQGHAALQRALETGEAQSFEVPLALPDGDKYFEARVVASGKDRAIIIVRETTDRVMVEQALRLQEERYRRIVEDMPALVCRFKPDGTLTFVNRLYCETFGSSKEALEGTNFFEFIPPEEREAVRLRYASLDLRNPVVTYVHQVVGPDGNLRWQRWTDRGMFDEDGGAVEYQSIGMDITQSYLSQLELESSRSLVVQTLRAANAGAWEWDLVANRSTWTDENFLVLGQEPHSLQPSYQAWLNCIHPDDRKHFSSQLMNAVDHRANLDIDYRVVWPDGGVRWLRCIARLLQDEQGEPVSMYGIQIDVTEHKEIEHEIRALNEQLEQRVQARTEELIAANRDLESFAYSVSHDLRSPLRGIAGYASLLAMEYQSDLPAEAQELLENIQKYTQLMSNLIDDLLNFSRLGRKELNLVRVDVGALAREVVERLLKLEEERQIEVTFGDLPPALADPGLLEQVFTNLVGNAVKYTRPRPVAQIEVGAQAGTEPVVYFVRDNGVGFDMKFADRLFGVFQRLHLSDEFEGTGIGLANVKRIIDRHGGKIWVEAALDEGAAFYFTL